MRKSRVAAWNVVFCGWLAFLCSFIDRLIWPPVIPLAAQEIGITSVQAGSFMSAFFFGYVLTQLPGGVLADRWGTRRILLGSFLLMGLFTALFAAAPNYWIGTALRFLAGISSGAVLAASAKGVYDYFGPERRATAMGVFMTSAPLGLMVANILAPVAAAQYGWRMAFLLAGALTFMGFALGWLLLPRQAELRLAATPGRGSLAAQMGRLMANRALVLTAAAGFFAMWGTWGTLTWANAYMHQGLGLSLQRAGQIMALFGVGALVGQPLAGWLSDRMSRRRREVSMAILAGFAGLLWLFGNNQDAGLLLGLVPLLGAGAFIFGPVLNTFISELVDAKQVASAIGLCNAIWQVGSLISPLLAGKLLDQTGSYIWVFTLLAAGPVLAVLLLAQIRLNPQRKYGGSFQLFKRR